VILFADAERSNLQRRRRLSHSRFAMGAFLALIATCIALSQATRPDMSPIADGERAFYHGTINGTLEVELKLTRKGNLIEGSYEYAAHRQALVLRGELLTDGALRLLEYANGKPNGDFHLDELGGLGHLSGTWKSGDGKRSYPVYLGKLDEQQHLQLQRMWNERQPIKSIAVGEFYGCALRETGAWCWGDALFMPSLAAAGPGMIAKRALPNLLVSAGASAMSISGSQTCVLDAGAMKCWQTSWDMKWFLVKPTTVKGLESDVQTIGTGGSFACALSHGRFTCWDGLSMNPSDLINVANDVAGLSSGSPRCAILAIGFKCWKITLRYSPFEFDAQEKIAVTETVEHLSASSDDGNGSGFVCWTHGEALRCNAEEFRSEADKRIAAANQFASGVTDVAVGDDHSCLIWKTEVYCWGANDHGQLGDGSRRLATPTGNPVKVSLPGRARQVAVSTRVSCALVETNEVYCWGANEFGQTGNATRDTCQMPNGHYDTIFDPCNLKPVPVLGLSE
jgi:Regulator of chromosome condensation (RCC1) repeat